MFCGKLAVKMWSRFLNRFGHSASYNDADTDIAILLMFYYSQMKTIKEAWLHKSGEFLPIHAILNSLAISKNSTAEDVSRNLLCGYVLSGCDTVSYPFSRGKRRAAKISLDCIGKINSLAEYGENNIIVDSQIEEDARLFLYGYMAETTCLNHWTHFANISLHLRKLIWDHFHQRMMPFICISREHFINFWSTSVFPGWKGNSRYHKRSRPLWNQLPFAFYLLMVPR